MKSRPSASVLFAPVCLLALALPSPAADGPTPLPDHELSRLVELYKEFHRSPELSFQEVETARRLASALRETGAEVTTNVGGTGVVAILKNGEGPTVLVRTDLDALPVDEQTGLDYASKVEAEGEDGTPVGVMHACGHDMHMTCLVGTARWLAANKGEWKGTAVLIGQPAEEKVGGAKAMLEDGLYTRFPKPDAAIALHVAHDLETGKIGYCPGAAMASSTALDVTIRGKGGHGAAPHATVDPIVLAAAFVLDLQSIVSREIDPLDPAVVTVGSIHGGSKHNIIPPEVRLQFTIRAYKDEVRAALIDGIRRRAEHLSAAHRAPAPTVEIAEGVPPTINTVELVDRVVPAFVEALGRENVVLVPPVMGAEDFGLLGSGGVPTFMYRLGTIDADRIKAAESGGASLPSLHSPFYYPDPLPSIATGVRATTAALRELLPAD